MTTNTLIVGASGGIGRSLVEHFARTSDKVIAVSRSQLATSDFPVNVECRLLSQQDDVHISALVEEWVNEGVLITTVVITTGVLHDDEKAMHPEKRLEDVSEVALNGYFAVNSIIPALWLKYLIRVMDKNNATVVCLSARVGSISDNRLGGWYGYRASKAALNMFVKTASVEYQRRLKNAMLVCYHPGTVDTALSKPFQKNVAAKKLFTPEFTVSQLVSHLSTLDRDQVCHFIDWNGHVVTW